MAKNLALYSIWIAPLITLVYQSFFGHSDGLKEKWDFVFNQMVPGLISNTFSLLILSIFFATCIALTFAFILELTNIKGKKIWSVLSFLPLSIPMYILAYIYVGATEWSSPLMTFIRENISHSVGSFQYKNVVMVALVFALGLYPYLLIPLRRKLKVISGDYYLTALLLKQSHLKVITSLILPLLKKPLLIGVSLFSMEVLADFGGVMAFNFETFTTAIYTSWSGLYSYQIACRLSLFLLSFTLIFFFIEGRSEEDKYSLTTVEQYPPIRLKGFSSFICMAIMLVISTFAFIFPVTQLLIWFLKALESGKLSVDSFGLVGNTLFIAFSVACLAIAFSLVSIFIDRALKKLNLWQRVSLFGYAIPGNIIAIAVFWLGSFFANSSSVAFSTVILLFGLAYRFLALPYKHLYNEAAKFPEELEIVSRSLKQKSSRFFKSIWLPKLKKSLGFAFVIMILETAKEMPMTLMLRPIGLDTLSTKVFELTSEGEWERASMHACILILLGVISTYLILRGEERA